jgi:hypothetical protein
VDCCACALLCCLLACWLLHLADQYIAFIKSHAAILTYCFSPLFYSLLHYIPFYALLCYTTLYRSLPHSIILRPTAHRVLQLDPETDKLRQIGPVWTEKYKWLRGVPVGDVIYGLPCHADSVLRIHVPTGEITTIPIAYEDFFADDPDGKLLAQQQRRQEWKYHGGNVSPVDGCIYAIPQSARHVLKIDPSTDTCHLVGPPLVGRYQWYGGVIGKQDGAIYGIPHDATQVLRIHPTEGVTLHGHFPANNVADRGHQWHGAAAAANGTIVCVPANANQVLCITPGSPEPTFALLGDASVIQTGRHRKDEKYKYLGAMTGTDGKVYVFPSGSEYVLQVDTVSMTLQNVGKNIYDDGMERLCQNKWQNGVTVGKYVYGIPLAAESLLLINTETLDVTTWPLPQPYKGLAKFEGAVVAPNGVIYTVPNNFKAVLRIEPAGLHVALSSASQVSNTISVETNSNGNVNDREPLDDSVRHLYPYQSGIPTLRSSAHRVKYKPTNRRHDPKPKNRHGEETNTPRLPESLCKECVFAYNTARYDLQSKLQALLARCDPSMVGEFRPDSQNRLEDFIVAVKSTWRAANGGQCEKAQKYLSDMVESDVEFMTSFDDFVQGMVLPHFKQRLIEQGAVEDSPNSVVFYYQRPPTIRLQPGPAWAQVKAHNDAEYGHQDGELNFWISLTDRALTGVDLYCESELNKADYHPVVANPGEVISFHGSSCRHYVNPNASQYTRVSMDFRVGVQGFFDPYWQMKGTTDDHGRKEVAL